MECTMKDNGKMIYFTDREFSYTLMEIFIKETGRMGCLKALDCMSEMTLYGDMMDNGIKEFNQERERKHSKTLLFTKDNLREV